MVVITVIPDPTVAAPTPPVRDPASVISVFSEAYQMFLMIPGELAGQSATLTEATIAGDSLHENTQGYWIL